jgi:iron-sulfur cluster assembly protein
MLVTENAAKQIKKLLEKQQLPGGGLRVGVKAGGCSGLSYIFDWAPAPRADDVVLEHEPGAKVFVDPKSLRFLDNTTLDYDTSLISKGFFFHNPDATSTCGCGVSFSV